MPVETEANLFHNYTRGSDVDESVARNASRIFTFQLLSNASTEDTYIQSLGTNRIP